MLWMSGRVFPAEETAHKKAWDGVMRADFEAQQELREAGVQLSKWRLVEDEVVADHEAVSYTHLTLPTTKALCRSRWSPYH